MSSLVYLFLTAVLLSGCTSLLYPAERRPYIDKQHIIPYLEDVFIPVPGGEKSFVHAWLFRAVHADKSKGIAVHFHGNGQNLSAHFMFFRWLPEYDYDYLIFDYRGYGKSSDENASPEKTVQDGLAVMAYVQQAFPNKALVTIGQSLGSNVMQRTLQEMSARGLPMPKLAVFDSSFLSYQEAASSVLGQRWFLYPLKPLAYVVINDDWSAKVKKTQSPAIPALFFHGNADQIINFDLGQSNFNNWPGPKHFITQESGTHTSAFGDKRFVKNKAILLSCMESAIDSKKVFADCLRMEKTD